MIAWLKRFSVINLSKHKNGIRQRCRFGRFSKNVLVLPYFLFFGGVFHSFPKDSVLFKEDAKSEPSIGFSKLKPLDGAFFISSSHLYVLFGSIATVTATPRSIHPFRIYELYSQWTRAPNRACVPVRPCEEKTAATLTFGNSTNFPFDTTSKANRETKQKALANKQANEQVLSLCHAEYSQEPRVILARVPCVVTRQISTPPHDSVRLALAAIHGALDDDACGVVPDANVFVRASAWRVSTPSVRYELPISARTIRPPLHGDRKSVGTLSPAAAGPATAAAPVHAHQLSTWLQLKSEY